jgi:hypothetical protein
MRAKSVKIAGKNLAIIFVRLIAAWAIYLN